MPPAYTAGPPRGRADGTGAGGATRERRVHARPQLPRLHEFVAPLLQALRARPPRSAPSPVLTGSRPQKLCKTGQCRVSAPPSGSLMPVAHTTLMFIRMHSCTARGTPAKRPRSCPRRPGPIRTPRRAPELRYSKAKRRDGGGQLEMHRDGHRTLRRLQAKMWPKGGRYS